MRKVSLLVAVLLALVGVGCGNDDDSSGDSSATTTASGVSTTKASGSTSSGKYKAIEPCKGVDTQKLATKIGSTVKSTEPRMVGLKKDVASCAVRFVSGVSVHVDVAVDRPGYIMTDALIHCGSRKEDVAKGQAACVGYDKPGAYGYSGLYDGNLYIQIDIESLPNGSEALIKDMSLTLFDDILAAAKR
jgi:hypothetical protein